MRMSPKGLGRVKTKSDLVVTPSGRQIFAFFALRRTVEPKIPGAVIPRRVNRSAGVANRRVLRGRSLSGNDTAVRENKIRDNATPTKLPTARKISPRSWSKPPL